MKFIFLIFFTVTFANASFLYDKKGICIEDYYFEDEDFHYLVSSSGEWESTGDGFGSDVEGSGASVLSSYIYDDENDICNPSHNIGGLTDIQFNFLMALNGLIFSALISYIIFSLLAGL
jgi:hypothetical protein